MAGLMLFIAMQQLRRPPGLEQALLGGLLPITTIKWPWLILVIVMVLLLWLTLKRTNGRRGLGGAIWTWALRLGLSWSAAVLLVLVGVIIYGSQSRRLADLNWPFALGSVGTAAALLLACALGWSRTRLADARHGK
jgi:hypothetical protein